jgi:hypothetical protein
MAMIGVIKALPMSSMLSAGGSFWDPIGLPVAFSVEGVASGESRKEPAAAS